MAAALAVQVDKGQVEGFAGVVGAALAGLLLRQAVAFDGAATQALGVAVDLYAAQAAMLGVGGYRGQFRQLDMVAHAAQPAERQQPVQRRRAAVQAQARAEAMAWVVGKADADVVAAQFDQAAVQFGEQRVHQLRGRELRVGQQFQVDVVVHG
ncbi:hypothetical protein D3C85_1335560 [compost metagenome]